MPDKVQLIKEAIIAYKGSIEGFEECFEAGKGKMEAINHILKIIDSLPEGSNAKNEDSSDECPCCGWSLDSDGCCSSCEYGRK